MLRAQIHRLPSPAVVVIFLKIAAVDENTVGEYRILWVYESYFHMASIIYTSYKRYIHTCLPHCT